MNERPSVEYVGKYSLVQWIGNLIKWIILNIIGPFISFLGLIMGVLGDYDFGDKMWDNITRDSILSFSAIQNWANN